MTSDAGQQQAKRARKSQNNVSLSLARMARAKSSTTAWLKMVDRGHGGYAPVSVNVHVQPSCTQLRMEERGGCDTSSSIVVASPLSHWSPGPHPASVRFACSFCADDAAVTHVRYNAMLPHSYVLLCGACNRVER